MPKEKGKHLTIADRVRIEEGINNAESLSGIARAIDVATSTVSREIKTNRRFYLPKGLKKTHLCVHKRECFVKGLCSTGHCDWACRYCKQVSCSDLCQEFEEELCDYLRRAPFVCARCKKKANCTYRRSEYRAIYAQEAYEKRLVSTREGISVTPEELSSMVRTVKRLLCQGQSLEAIWTTHKGHFPVGVRTFYNYVGSGIFGIANIELPKKVRYKPRKKLAVNTMRIDTTGRSYADYLTLPEDVRRSAGQMDCVMGVKGDFACIFTVHLPRFEFQIYLLLTDHTQQCVIGALDWIEMLCEGSFRECFPVILTDRGQEFKDYGSLERSAFTHSTRTRIYYCDPMRSNQKASCERNHAELRRIIPKGTSLEGLSTYAMATVSSHINSYPRPSLGGLCPLSLASQVLPKSLLDGLGITRIAPDEVIMTPSLLKKH